MPNPVPTCRKCGSTERCPRSGRCLPCNRKGALARYHANRGTELEHRRRQRATSGPRKRSLRRWPQDKARKARSSRAWEYGLPLDVVDALLATLECQCCSRPFAGGVVRNIDHDHSTNAVRGVICTNCNTGLGHFGDDATGTRRALAYLERCESDEAGPRPTPPPKDPRAPWGSRRGLETQTEKTRRQRMRACGLTGEAVDALLLTPECSCCGRVFVDGQRRNLDPCPDARGARGVLCRGCNVGLGNFGGTASGIRAALAYLEAEAQRMDSGAMYQYAPVTRICDDGVNTNGTCQAS